MKENLSKRNQFPKNQSPRNQSIRPYKAGPLKYVVLPVCLFFLGFNLFSLILPGGFSSAGGRDARKLNRMLSLSESNLYDGRRILEYGEELGLTAKQRKKTETLMMAQEAFSIRNQAEIKIKELEFASYLKSGQMERKEVEKYIRAISKERTALLVHYINYLLDIRGLLTPAQKEKLTQIREKRKAVVPTQ